MSATLLRRGGAAAGDASHNPSGTSYAAHPPSSTYTGPKVAGTYTGFVGVLVGAGIFVLLLVAVLILWRLRTLRRANTLATAGTGTLYDPEDYGGAGGVKRWARQNDEAFELPSSLATTPFAAGASEDYLSAGAGAGGGRGRYTTPYGHGMGNYSASTVDLSPQYQRGPGGGARDSKEEIFHPPARDSAEYEDDEERRTWGGARNDNEGKRESA
ncbi:hypothetical protein JCM10207_001796 [Rhodosporidiobolus poonsookiae]